MQPRYQYAQFPLAARVGQGGMTHVVIQVNVAVFFPVRCKQTTEKAGPRQLVAPGSFNGAAGFHSGEDILEECIRGILRQRKYQQVTHVHGGIF